MRFHQKLRVSKKARGFVNFDLLLDGEEAMRNLEAAQVKMEEKLNYMTNFNDRNIQFRATVVEKFDSFWVGIVVRL